MKETNPPQGNVPPEERNCEKLEEDTKYAEKKPLIGSSDSQAFENISPRLKCLMLIILSSILFMVFLFIVLINLHLELSQKPHITRFKPIEFPPNRTVNNGKLVRTGDLNILFCSGSSYEMGYAHGQILGNLIKYSVEYIVSMFDKKETYEELVQFIMIAFNVNNTFRDEIRGIYEGALNEKYDLFVKLIDRDWTISDLWVVNFIYDWNQNVQCSGVGISKELSKISEIFGGRILDFPIDDQGILPQLNLITIFNNEVLSFGYVGLISIITGKLFFFINLDKDLIKTVYFSVLIIRI